MMLIKSMSALLRPRLVSCHRILIVKPLSHVITSINCPLSAVVTVSLICACSIWHEPTVSLADIHQSMTVKRGIETERRENTERRHSDGSFDQKRIHRLPEWQSSCELEIMHEGHTEIIVINYDSAAATDANRIPMDTNFIVWY
ncbi:PREDICTED: uncharacterized protein LOC105455576 isoform X2 [Wasmannia auropunctata]|uniref:uncharacterized protein LOC105455576 isoform X2 n=1 Tax=Wasmannia auropunctata TaxID=64793 RepID=UPI0005EFF684|nr:PREDICTED: uncharacterized protein LOC105455576 isoform X2 [Wasmannia auropunctata]XP_011697319.1 PREDICTED: uncharacterized protein LOC105455576 isoform X2 [Wasmannia auropunctata]